MEKEMRRLSVAAKEFVPRSSPSQPSILDSEDFSERVALGQSLAESYGSQAGQVCHVSLWTQNKSMALP